MRSKTRHDEAQALRNARRLGAEEERGKLQGVIEEQKALIEELRSQLAKK